MNKSALLISTLLAATAVTGIAQSADKSAEKLGEHPAVIVARNWNARSIDPNTFIVAHPARLQLLAASPNAKKETVVQATAPTAPAAGK
jgi:hypothetical protein